MGSTIFSWGPETPLLVCKVYERLSKTRLCLSLGNLKFNSLLPMESVFLFFLLFHLPGSSSEGFTYHQHTPAISSTTANPARYSGDVGSIKLRKALSKAHGILMIVAWPWLAGTAMLFAAFLKPVLKKGKWFQVWHPSLDLSSLPPSLIPPSLPHPSLPTSLPPSTGTSCLYAGICSSGGRSLRHNFCCTCGQHASGAHGPH